VEVGSKVAVGVEVGGGAVDVFVKVGDNSCVGVEMGAAGPQAERKMNTMIIVEAIFFIYRKSP
jgi:hypothetical protein